MGRRLEIQWQEDAATLFQLYQQETLPDLRPRLHGLWLLHTGREMTDTAAMLKVHYRTVQRWVAWYRRGGIEEVLAHRDVGQGKTPLLTPQQQAMVRDTVAQGVFHTAKDVLAWVEQTFGVHYSLKGMYSLLAKLQGRKKVPRPLSPYTSLEVQEAWNKGAAASPGRSGVSQETALGLADPTSRRGGWDCGPWCVGSGGAVG